MVIMSNPFCPVSFGFLGFLGSVLSRRSFLYGESESSRGQNKIDEEEDLLAAGEADCDALSEDRISTFLENQKSQYYRSIGMVPPKQLKTIETSTTPGASIIEFSSSRETSYLDESEESALIALNSTTPAPEPLAATPQTFRMDESDNDHRNDEAQSAPFEPVTNVAEYEEPSLKVEKVGPEPGSETQKQSQVDFASLASLASDLLDSEDPFSNADQEQVREDLPESRAEQVETVTEDDLYSIVSPECDVEAYLSANDEEAGAQEH